MQFTRTAIQSLQQRGKGLRLIKPHGVQSVEDTDVCPRSRPCWLPVALDFEFVYLMSKAVHFFFNWILYNIHLYILGDYYISIILYLYLSIKI